ncbi:MAG: class I SAM-dependent methyltransferase [Hydrococcus sp. Prado102]|jgi:ubiquinone/menaquinone biosynthesis C-methylase UbiE|nr:class I SAM-dependent methyltransferase [Hydrococcus sp. Prado102]
MSDNNFTSSTIETNPLKFFSGRGENYEKYRPSHPNAAIDKILTGLESNTQLVAADIGAGTGIGSRLLADRGIRVLAIEPNADMKSSATPHELVEFLTGTAEEIPLPSASLDLVTSFQAFHWFDFINSLQEFRRILKPNGRLALIWTLWDDRDVVSKHYCRLISEASKEYQRKARSQIGLKTLLKKLRYQMFWRGLWLPYFKNLQLHWFDSQQELDLTGLIGLAQSQGFIPQESKQLEQLISKLSIFHSRFCNKCDRVRLAYRTRLYLATSIKLP